VKSIGLNKIKYTSCNAKNDSIKEIARSSVFMVNSPGGKSEILTHLSTDSLQKPEKGRKIHLFLELGGGTNSPVGVFGSNNWLIPASSPEEATFVGFASSGYMYDMKIGMKLNNGWGILFDYDYYHNRFDATGYLNENIANFDVIYEPSHYIYNPIAIGSYSYNQSSFFGGITYEKPVIKESIFSLGFQFLIGGFYANIPAVKGVADTNQYSKGNKISVNIPNQNGEIFGFNLGLRLCVHIFKPLYIVFVPSYTFGGSPTNNTAGTIAIHTSNTDLLNYTFGIRVEY
jgi:hypothetical protein